MENHLFLPDGTERSYELLVAKNGADGYFRVAVPNYHHMDCFIGKDAAQDIYPLILAQLDGYNPAPPATRSAASATVLH
jgi:cholesterol oxidase